MDIWYAILTLYISKYKENDKENVVFDVIWTNMSYVHKYDPIRWIPFNFKIFI